MSVDSDIMIAEYKKQFERANPGMGIPDIKYVGGWFQNGISRYRASKLQNMTAVLRERADIPVQPEHKKFSEIAATIATVLLNRLKNILTRDPEYYICAASLSDNAANYFRVAHYLSENELGKAAFTLVMGSQLNADAYARANNKQLITYLENVKVVKP